MSFDRCAWRNVKEDYERDGFVKVGRLVPLHVYLELNAACGHVIKKARSGEWPHRRTTDRQFPPWGDEYIDTWGAQHLMHPDLDEPAFLAFYTSDKFINIVLQLLECKEEDLQMELYNLLISPFDRDFALRWHRDDIKETASEEEESKALALWQHGVQWNTALLKDESLFVVPGSHKVPRTPEQRKHSESMEAPKDPMDMPGAVHIVLEIGETLFYNSNILHCSVTSADHIRQRMTLHGCIGDARGGSVRARNILQHDLSWMKEDRFRNKLEGRSLKMWEKLMEMEKGVSGDLGDSLD